MKIKEWLQQSEVAMFRQVLYTAEGAIDPFVLHSLCRYHL